MSNQRTESWKTHDAMRSRAWYVQRRPYVNPLPYSSAGGHDVRSDSMYPVPPLIQPYSAGAIWGWEADASLQAREAYAKAYDRLISQIRGEATASLAASAAEGRESFAMIANRAIQLRNGYTALKKGNIPGMLRSFGFELGRKPKGGNRRPPFWVRMGPNGKQHTISTDKVSRDSHLLRRGARDAASTWLEYWFGWSPLIADIQSAVQVLTNPVTPQTLRNVFRGTGTSVRQYSHSVNNRYSLTTDSFTATFFVSLQCTCTVSSPNLALANRLGILNPLSVAWEITPFSWLIDWFVPVGRFLESWTDTVGFNINRIIRSERRTCTRNLYDLAKETGRLVTNDSTSYSFNRTLPGALHIPGWRDRQGKGVSGLTRAATAISLLVQQLKSR